MAYGGPGIREKAMTTSDRVLPQLAGGLFLTDAGVETDLIFNHGIEIREFAAHTLLATREGREALEQYIRGFLELAARESAGLILDSHTWKAHPHWAADLEATEEDLRHANLEAVAFVRGLRDEYAARTGPLVLSGTIGPRGDSYAPEDRVTIAEAQAYHARQLGWLAEAGVDMVSALTFTQPDEAAGLVRAAEAVGLPAVISFTVETDGTLPGGEGLQDAIGRVDDLTSGAAAYFMVNCAHPDHFFGVLEDADWTRRIRGLRCNASRLSHAELDDCETLDAGDPDELAGQYAELLRALPWVNVLGGCCGTDLRHVTRIAEAVRGHYSVT